MTLPSLHVPCRVRSASLPAEETGSKESLTRSRARVSLGLLDQPEHSSTPPHGAA